MKSVYRLERYICHKKVTNGNGEEIEGMYVALVHNLFYNRKERKMEVEVDHSYTFLKHRSTIDYRNCGKRKSHF